MKKFLRNINFLKNLIKKYFSNSENIRKYHYKYYLYRSYIEFISNKEETDYIISKLGLFLTKLSEEKKSCLMIYISDIFIFGGKLYITTNVPSIFYLEDELLNKISEETGYDTILLTDNGYNRSNLIDYYHYFNKNQNWEKNLYGEVGY